MCGRGIGERSTADATSLQPHDVPSGREGSKPAACPVVRRSQQLLVPAAT